MNKTEQVAAEYQRRKEALKAAAFRVDEYGFEKLLVVEMFVKDEQTGEVLVRKQEGVAFHGRSEFLVECRKLMALERLTNVIPQMWIAYKARLASDCRRNQ